MNDFTGRLLATDGFVINGQRTTAIIDPLYSGGVVAVEPIPGVVGFGGTPSAETYRGDKILFVQRVSVAFGGRMLSHSVPLFRESDSAFESSGLHYDAVIGLVLLSQHIFVLDFTNMTMRVSDSPGPF
jgi:hypothetical protein